MVFISMFHHFADCLQRYSSRKKLASLSSASQKDLGIMQDSFESEVAKGNVFILVKELAGFAR